MTDPRQVTLEDDLEALRDDRDHVALTYNAPTSLTFGVAQAGPGELRTKLLMMHRGSSCLS